MFSPEEIQYLKTQRLARIATVSKQEQPDVAPVGFEFDGEHFYVGGRNPGKTLKYKNVASGNTLVALVVDDLESVTPWRPRGLKIHGTAEFVERAGYAGRGTYLRITPRKSWSWGIARPVFGDRGAK
jgi:pyridoxamine 5'-phosphate oxidase family protein